MGNTVHKNFYENLPVLDQFLDASNHDRYKPLPRDWFIAVTDIINSTKAIQDNQYKSVNIIGAAPIAGLLNLVDRNSIPYIFCGDGSIICVPPEFYNETKHILASCKQIGLEAYGLHLRASLIPVSYIYEQEKKIDVARLRVSDYYIQALFMGNGIRHAEKMLKNSAQKSYQIAMPEKSAPADFSGLECRWKEVKTPDKEVITLLVNANPAKPDPGLIYSEVLQKLNQIFGFDDATNPINPDNLGMYFSAHSLVGETRLRTFGMNFWERVAYLLSAEVEILLGKLYMFLHYRTSKTDWSLYKKDLSLNSDYRKFDDMLRIVISSTTQQRQSLEIYLQDKFRRADLAYGLHVADSAVITCMVFNYQHEHIHFVDGSNGGYVQASQELKKQMKKLKDLETKL